MRVLTQTDELRSRTPRMLDRAVRLQIASNSVTWNHHHRAYDSPFMDSATLERRRLGCVPYTEGAPLAGVGSGCVGELKE